MTRVLRPRKGRCGPRSDQDQATAAKKAERVRPRMQSADQVVDADRGPAPVDHAVGFRQPGRVGRRRIVLRPVLSVPPGDPVDNSHQQARSQARQIALDLVARLVLPDRAMVRREHGSCIERLHHAHDRDARRELAVDDRAVNRRRATVARQHRRVDVDQAEPRRRQDRVGEDLSVRGDDAEVRAQRGEAVEKRLILQAFRLQHGKAGGERARLHRRVRHPVAAAARAIRLCHDADHGVWRCGEQRVERRHRELRRAEEHDSKPVYHLPARESFRIFRTMRSRLMPRRRSTNSVPSR